jgi:hypothetical protein
MTHYAEHKRMVLDNRMDQDADKSPREPRTHDYTNRTFRWGWRMDIDAPVDTGAGIYRVSGLGPFIRTGDHVLMSVKDSNGKRGVMRLVLRDARYRDDPADKWEGVATHVRWEQVTLPKWVRPTVVCGTCGQSITERFSGRIGKTVFCSWRCLSAWELTKEHAREGGNHGF